MKKDKLKQLGNRNVLPTVYCKDAGVVNDSATKGVSTTKEPKGTKGVSIELFSHSKSLLTKPCHVALESS